jgi:hypothetical protein
MESLIHFCPDKDRLGSVLGLLEVFGGMGYNYNFNLKTIGIQTQKHVQSIVSFLAGP